MSENPFAPEPDPADEPVNNTEKGSTPVVSGEAPEPQDFHPYSVTFKGGDGYGAPWFVAKYRTLDDVERDLNENGPQVARILAKVAEVAKYFGSQDTGSKPRSSGGGGNGRPAGATQAPAWMGSPPSCRHGVKIYKTKMGANGQWHAWACNGKQGDQCSREENSLEFRNPPK